MAKVESEMDVSIVMPVHNNWHFTRDCLSDLEEFKGVPGVEIIVVDDASTDETRQELSCRETWLKVVRNQKNVGFSRSCNQGAWEAEGRYIIFLNNDMRTAPGWLNNMVQALEMDSDVGIVGARLLYPDGTLQHAGVVFDENLNGRHIYSGFDGRFPPACQKRDFQAVTGACLLVRSELFRSIGGFDEGYYMGYEDLDLCFRVSEKGFRVVLEPQAVLTHYESQSLGNMDPNRSNKNYRLFQKKWRHKIVPDEDRIYQEDGFSPVAHRLLRNMMRGDRRDFYIRKWLVSEQSELPLLRMVEEIVQEMGVFGVVQEVVPSSASFPGIIGALREDSAYFSEFVYLHSAGNDSPPLARVTGFWEIGDRAWRIRGPERKTNLTLDTEGEAAVFRFVRACQELGRSCLGNYRNMIQRGLAAQGSRAPLLMAEDLARWNRSSPECLKLLGDCCRAQADSSRAKDAYLEAIRLNPGYTAAIIANGEVLLQEGRLRQARESMERLLRLKPFTFPAYRIWLASVLGGGRNPEVV